MKKILFLLFLVLTLYGSTLLGQWYLNQKITHTLAETGLSIQIGEISAAFPDRILLKNVTAPEFDFTAKEISMRPILWRFLKGEIAFLQIEAKQVSLFGATLDFEGKFFMDENQAVAKGEIEGWKMSATLQRHTNALTAILTSADISLTLNKKGASLECFFEIGDTKGIAKGQIEHSTFTGSAVVNEQTIDFQIDPDGKFHATTDFDFGFHRIAGIATGHLLTKKGSFQGSYENYYTGTRFKNIQAYFAIQPRALLLQSLTAIDDRENGALAATGEIGLGAKHPFYLDLTLKSFQFTTLDLVTAAADGRVQLRGDIHSATAHGNLQIVESTLTIPDHVPAPLPTLDVTYINQSQHTTPLPEYTPYPLHLHLALYAPKVSILGRGLDSVWEGTFQLTGTLTNPSMDGQLQLLKGNFHLASRDFELLRGSLHFTGIEHQMPRIDLLGSTETNGVTITAQLNGPLDNPQISLHSNPPLPLSSIVSYLLFEQDLSEISAFQAIELAASLSNLAGTSPSSIESLRKSLGLDRVRLISDPTTDEAVALEVGKYVAKGVLVTITQGVKQDSTNIRIEVQIKGGLIFQLESDQHQEQGKFTLKWQVNY